MKNYTPIAREIPMDDTWDVIVVGGGPSGCAAAAAAARDGAKTLLLEASGCLGGMGTIGLVPAFCPYSDHERIIYGGLAEKLLNDMKARMPHVHKDHVDWVPIDAEVLKGLYDQMVTSAGAQVLFGMFLSGVDTNEDGSIRAIMVSSKAGLRAYKAKVYIDCTGDGDLAAWAGAEVLKDGVEGGYQFSTHCFEISNVDMYAFNHCGAIRYGGPGEERIYAMMRDEAYPLINDNHACNSLVGPGTIGLNAGHEKNVDPEKPETVSAALLQGRQYAAQFMSACKKHFPEAFSNAWLSQTAPALGIRESRRIKGEYVLTREDFLSRRSFADEIGRNCYYIDVHGMKGTEEEKSKRAVRYGKGESHGIPYRILIPEGCKDMLVAGRCVSCERDVQGSVRVMPVCLVMGEAAGAAAAMAAKSPSPDVSAVDVGVLRDTLRRYGAYLP